ncbi:MAG TPA: DUF3073 domain-containing protein [Actinocrinis sp.]|jgi:hypothetical protein
MGRGRAKAKQTKVARQLKYQSGGTDLDRLRSELGVNAGRSTVEDDELDERYAAWADQDEDEDDEDDDGDDEDEAEEDPYKSYGGTNGNGNGHTPRR